MGDFAGLLARLDPDVRVRGKQFEHVCKWYLMNDPTYKAALRRVWLWDEWPGRWGVDAGIDLVAEHYDGSLWAIQAKAYAPTRAVTKADVDKFLSESSRSVFGYRMLIATTDNLHHVARRTINGQEKQVAFVGLSDLITSKVVWRNDPLDMRPCRSQKPVKPRRHQREAVRDVTKGFATSDRGQLIMACGTGKTLTSLFVREKLAAERTLVLVPSLSLMKQTMHVWTASAKVPFDKLPVCSDQTVGRSNDDAAVAHTSELGLPVTTDPRAIAAFLRRRSGPRVVFATYQSSPQIASAFALGRVPAFDLVVADEAHRIAGPQSSDFATVLDNTQIRALKRLFMTATPRYFTGRVTQAAQGVDLEVASMDDTTRFGSIFHRLTFSDAISRELLTDYQVAVIGVDNATYREWAVAGTLVTRDGTETTNARNLASQIGLAKAVRKYDLRRTISFHSRVSRARDFAAEIPDVIAWMPKRHRPTGSLWARHASGEMSAGRRHVLLQQLVHLSDGERGLLTNARCLSEGVDVPTLDGVAFIDPRRSEVDIVQAVGRAIRKADGKTLGTIVIPVFIDTDTDPEVALNDSSFKPVWDVIKALRAHDELLGEQIDELRREMGQTGGAPKLPEKIHLDLPMTVKPDFSDAFDIRLVERTSQSWEFWFGLLEHYLDETGSAQVHKDEVVDGYRLGGWCVNQRAKARRGQLSADRKDRLDQLPGWVWDRHDSRWEKGFQRLTEYVAVNGHASIGSKEKFDGYSLGSWTAIQRRDYQNGSLTDDRQFRLSSINGWVWSLEGERWENGFRHLEEYLAAHGHSRVPQNYKCRDEFQLGAWVNFQRLRHTDGKLEPDRVERLGNLHKWVWKASEAKWDEGFQHLKEFADQHGHVQVPIRYEVQGFQLRTWYANQRAKFDRLSRERQQRLTGLPGWDDYSHDVRWEKAFRLLVAYVEDHGTARVDRAYTINGYPLGTWAMTQRLEFKRGKLAADRVKRLGDLSGWDWDRRNNKWDEGFRRLSAYLEQYGSPPPQNYEEGDYRLGAWAGQQRQLARSGDLQDDRRAKLDGLAGWDWNPPRGAAARRI
ncbi:DEAD/DEAH box helicase [Mycolicibacterium llatzerense]|uniref:DEAD/DEAH box helicase n=1 Tax=Mycolicibacterium llatzerense TaxID=280871 RepID=UPI0021B6739C|nr:DEAD/DEAH box helicase [Mycolicibacterium llatzerense]MCT7369603.1 helicase [Mycolicibacterium llatzerense]